MTNPIVPDVGLVRNILPQIQKAILAKTNDLVHVAQLLGLINMWSGCIPAVVESREAADLVFQYRTEVLKNWVDTSSNRPSLNSNVAIVSFRALVQGIMDYQANIKDSKEAKKPTVRLFIVPLIFLLLTFAF